MQVLAPGVPGAGVRVGVRYGRASGKFFPSIVELVIRVCKSSNVFLLPLAFLCGPLL